MFWPFILADDFSHVERYPSISNDEGNLTGLHCDSCLEDIPAIVACGRPGRESWDMTSYRYLLS